MTEKYLYLIRHGDPLKVTEDGLSIPDELRPLSDQGKQDVKALAEHLKELEVKPDVIVASLLVRARETAEIIRNELSGPAVEASPLIGEANLGSLSSNPDALKQAEFGYHTELVLEAGGESIDEVEKRIVEFISQLEERDESTILVVSHGLTLSVFSQIMQDLDRTFANIQVLKTADYSYFVWNSNTKKAVEFKTNQFRGK